MTRPLRICLVTTFYPPYNFGGDGIDVQRLARALTRRGHDVTVVHDVDAYRWLAGGEPTQAVESEPFEVLRLRSRLGVGSALLTHQLGRPIVHGRRLERLFRERPFDVVTFNNVSLVGGPGILRYGGDAVRVYIAHEHWLVCATHVLWRHNREACPARQCTRCVLSYHRPPQAWRYTGFLERQLRHVDTFIARSAFSRDKHRAFGFSREMEVLPYFVPEPAATVEDVPSPHPRPYFLFVGRIEKIKGLETIVPAFDRYPDADLLVIGDGTEAAALRAMAAAQPRVRFLGRVANAELGAYYRHAIAAIVPSVGFETFGLVLIEAFQRGTPVIVRRIGPFPELVEQSGGGELFGDEAELLAAMRRLQHTPGRRAALGGAAQRTVPARWSEDVVVTGFLDIVARAARRRAARLGRPLPVWIDGRDTAEAGACGPS